MEPLFLFYKVNIFLKLHTAKIPLTFIFAVCIIKKLSKKGTEYEIDIMRKKLC